MARAIYTTSTEADVTVVAHSTDVDPQAWRPYVALEALPQATAYGLFDGPDGASIAAVVTDAEAPIESYTLVSKDTLRQLGGNLAPLFAAAATPPKLNGTNDALPPLAILPERWPVAERRAAFEGLLAQIGGDITTALSILGAALHEQRLIVRKYPAGDRLAFVQGLMALLPSTARAELTFSTYLTSSAEAATPRVVFSAGNNTSRWVIDWEMQAFPDDKAVWSGYVAQLATLWAGDVPAFLDAIDDIDQLAVCVPVEQSAIARLDRIVELHTLDTRIVAEDATAPEKLKAALHEGDLLPLDVKERFARALLPHALNNRDFEADSLIAAYMDEYPAIDAVIFADMNDLLEFEPDLVYTFVRQRLSEGVTPRWLGRLQDAAVCSLRVAIASDEPNTIVNWLRLIAREPSRYELNTVLKEGLRASTERAYSDSTLALGLLSIAARHAPNVLDSLLNDEKLVDALPEPYTAALLKYDRAALGELQAQAPALYLAGMMRAARDHAPGAFTNAALEALWTQYSAEDGPATAGLILAECADSGPEWLNGSLQETLLALSLTERTDPMFRKLAHNMAQVGTLGDRLGPALIRSGRGLNAVLDTIATLAAANDLTQQEAANLYYELLNEWGWIEATMPLMEQFARTLTQNPEVDVPDNVLETLLDTAAEHRDESLARVAALRLLKIAGAEHQSSADDGQFVERLQSVFGRLAWSNSARQAALDWWRTYIQGLQAAQLSRLAKAMDGLRVLESAQHILRSVSALRKLLGKRDLNDFAESINTAYNALELLAESFEPDDKQTKPISFDPETVRSEMDRLSSDMTPHARQILANSLKGLAALIAQMGDNRSKGSFARRSDNIDRSLMTGEQQPGSAVDAMKWLAGYLRGSQDTEDS